MLRAVGQRQLPGSCRIGGWAAVGLALGLAWAPQPQHSRIHKQILHERGTVPAHRDASQTDQHSLVARETEVTL